MVEMTAQKLFGIGVILLVFGIQLRAVDTFVLNEKASRFVEKRMRQSAFQQGSSYSPSLLSPSLGTKKQLSHPRWLGWALISTGVVLILHGVTAKKNE